MGKIGGSTKTSNNIEDPETNKIRKKLQETDSVLHQEEVYWFRKSREEWIASGDRNTRFYHASTMIKRNGNRIGVLKNAKGEWTSNTHYLEQMAMQHFHNPFTVEQRGCQTNELTSGFPTIPESKLHMLSQQVSQEEVKQALFEMSPSKAPGVDGLQAGFYLTLW